MSTPEWPVPAEVEAVVRRALTADREFRWPDVLAFTAALTSAAGGATSPSGAPRVLPLDPDRTQPGARPSPLTARAALGEPTPPPVSRRRRLLVAAGALALLVAGGLGGYTAWRAADSTTTLTDTRSALSVTVPDGWDGESATDGW